MSSSTLSAQPPSSEPPVADEIISGDNRELAASYARYSSDNQDPTSITQQHDKNRQAATRNDHHIPKTLEFSDAAVSGTKLRRAGLDALIDGAKNGKFRIIYLWAASRLAREIAIAIPLLKELVKVYGVRIICTADGIDTHQKSWEFNAIFRSYMAQEYLEQLRADVKRGIYDALERGYSVGDVCFGYKTEPIPGQVCPGSNKKGRLRKQRIIDSETSQWVVKIFYLYVVELRSINWIRNELNRLKAPKDTRSTSRKGWLNTCVRNVLANLKYVGIWRYGLSQVITNPITGAKTQIQRKDGDPEIVTKHFPELRIIDDGTFEKAQVRLRDNEERTKSYRYKSGRFKGSCKDCNAPRHILQGLLKCSQCGSTLQMNGLRGLYLQCSAYPRNECSVKTSLLRSFAEREILRIVGNRLLEDQRLRTTVWAAVQRAWEQHQAQSPLEKQALERRKREIKKKIDFLVNQVEEGACPPDIVARLNTRRLELIEIERQENNMDQPPLKLESPPTEEWVMEQLKKLHQVLLSEPALAGVALRKLIGSIEVSEVEVPGLKRKNLVGRFQLQTSQVIASAVDLQNTNESEAEEIAIRFAELPVWAQRADEAKAMYDLNLSAADIASKLGLKFGAIAKALRRWYSQRDLPVPSGAEKRARCIRPTPIQDAVKETVLKLYQEGWALHLIAKEVGCSRNSVTAMIKKWHEETGQPWLNGQARRKKLREEREAEQKKRDAA